jgi:hypothetical protein
MERVGGGENKSSIYIPSSLPSPAGEGALFLNLMAVTEDAGNEKIHT